LFTFSLEVELKVLRTLRLCDISEDELPEPLDVATTTYFEVTEDYYDLFIYKAEKFRLIVYYLAQKYVMLVYYFQKKFESPVPSYYGINRA
jgi:hypothetical protein